MDTSLDFLFKIFSELVKEIGDRKSIFNKPRLLDRILEVIADRFNAEACSIFLSNDEQSVNYICVAGKGYSSDISGKAVYKIDENFTGFVLRNMKSYNIKSKEELKKTKELNGIVSTGKYDDIMWDEKKGRVFKNLLIVPLVLENHSIGVLKAENKKNSNGFSDEEFQTLQITGHLITLAVSYANLYEKFEKSKKYNEIINLLPQLLLSKQKKETLENLMKLTMDFFSAEVCFIFLRNPEKQNFLYCAAGAGYAAQVVNQPKVEYELGKFDGLTGTIADSKQSVLVNNEAELIDYRNKGIAKSRADEFLEKRGQFKNMIGAPLLKVDIKGDRKIIGVIKVENKKFGDSFTINDKSLLETIAGIAAITIDSFEEKNINEAITVNASELSDNKNTLDQARKEISQGNLSRSIELTLLVAENINDQESIKSLNISSFRLNQLEKEKNQGTIDFTQFLSISTSISSGVQQTIEEIEDKIKKKKNH